ncbi:MAG: transcriptional regulator [Deltaproteobacteria bacterium RIFOXYA12_FULL_58_15]|nr:MAG: transcriptional regulator [Deltaproteobacteria bacterium RIFOXYA12_FULL_58_15]OGR08625.1 MAG: transcriptional regulator [Deltaproteobacteria bacterium RIFOXYB12_FULL_58_9]
MKTKKWTDVRRQLSPEREKATRKWVAKKVLEADLASMRKLVGKTQTQVSESAAIAQGELSKLERRDDHLVSTLRRYVTALGGELDIIARFGDKMIKLRGV